MNTHTHTLLIKWQLKCYSQKEQIEKQTRHSVELHFFFVTSMKHAIYLFSRSVPKCIQAVTELVKINKLVKNKLYSHIGYGHLFYGFNIIEQYKLDGTKNYNGLVFFLLSTSYKKYKQHMTLFYVFCYFKFQYLNPKIYIIHI